ncbi:hypothetical protein HAX54_024728, partial [Datura stramonium]|nr:hypothetical protein [Datura stramonium]
VNTSITVESQFEVESFKDYLPNIYNEMGISVLASIHYTRRPGQEVNISLEAINSIYCVDPIRPSLEFRRK